MTPRESTGGRRGVLAEGVIGVGLCVALHLFVAQPLHRAFAEKRAEADRLSSECREVGTLASRMPDVVRALARDAAAAAELESRGAPAKDESAVFASIMELARECKVQVDTIAPATTPALPPSKTDPRLLPARSDRSVSFSVRASGSFEDVSHFLWSLQNRLAYTLVSSLRLTPASGPDDGRVHASIDTSHFYVNPAAPSTPVPAAAPQEPAR